MVMFLCRDVEKKKITFTVVKKTAFFQKKKMCKEADEVQPVGEERKVNIPNGLPEPGKPVNPPKDAMIPPKHGLGIAEQKPTIAAAETFEDKELSEVSGL